MKLPISLVKTWLELSSDIDPESSEACNSAIEKINHYFGNPDIAEDYVYSNQKPTNNSV